MMKRLFVSIVVLMALASSAESQTFTEVKNVFAEAWYAPSLSSQVVMPGKKADLTVWFYVSETWAEGLVGATRSVKPWMWLGLTAGFETNGKPLRISPQGGVMNSRGSVYLITEFGGSGFWYKSVGTVKLTKTLEVGYHSQRFYGTGPLVRVNLPGKMAAWVSVVPGPQATVGIKKSF